MTISFILAAILTYGPGLHEADRDFRITDFGAKPDGTKCTSAFAAAIAAAVRDGGGRVVVPAGEWFTDSIRLASEVELHLDDRAIVRFANDPDAFALVPSTYEGIEGEGRCPCVYAYACTNVAVTGGGTFTTVQHPWRAIQIAKDPKIHAKALFRPHMIQLNRCKNARLEGFKIRYSPFWLVEILLSEDVTVRGLDTFGMWGNSDGIDIESSRRVLVENCTLDQNDDAFCIKSGRDAFGRARGVPTEDVEIRNCHVKHAGGMLTIGSEISGGARNIYLHDVTAECVRNVFVLRSWHTRGGRVENVRFEDVDVDRCEQRFFATRSGWPVKKGCEKEETFWTAYDDISLKRVHVRDCGEPVFAVASPEVPFRNVRIADCSIDEAHLGTVAVTNTVGCDFSGVKVGRVVGTARPDRVLMRPGAASARAGNVIPVVFCETEDADAAERAAKECGVKTVHLGAKWTASLASRLRERGLKTARWTDGLVENLHPDELADVAEAVPRDVELWYRDDVTGVGKVDNRKWLRMRNLVRHGWPVVLVPTAKGADRAKNEAALRRTVDNVSLFAGLGWITLIPVFLSSSQF